VDQSMTAVLYIRVTQEVLDTNKTKVWSVVTVSCKGQDVKVVACVPAVDWGL
jgi:hypothetical protein